MTIKPLVTHVWPPFPLQHFSPLAGDVARLLWRHQKPTSWHVITRSLLLSRSLRASPHALVQFYACSNSWPVDVCVKRNSEVWMFSVVSLTPAVLCLVWKCSLAVNYRNFQRRICKMQPEYNENSPYNQILIALIHSIYFTFKSYNKSLTKTNYMQ